MGRAEQAEEREVLDSIFPDEITDVSDTEYRIEVKLDLPAVDNEEDDEPRKPDATHSIYILCSHADTLLQQPP